LALTQRIRRRTIKNVLKNQRVNQSIPLRILDNKTDKLGICANYTDPKGTGQGIRPTKPPCPFALAHGYVRKPHR
jgi:hypothetical protein